MKLATLPSSGWRGVLAAAAVYLYCFVQTVAASQQVEQFTSLSPAPAPQLDADFAIKAATCDNLKPLGSKSEYCPYIRANCPADSIISYLEVYYCYAAPAGWLAEACICVMFALLLVLLFRVLGSTAEDYFSPILSQLSQEMGLPPRFAGVTFLALGNGAPDLSASIAAVKAGHYHLALGGLLGGGMFVGCVVAGLIVLANNGAKARGALLRDVAAYMTSVVVVALMIHSGTMTTGKAVTLLGLYVLFVLVVLGADIWHRVCGAGSQSFKELQEDLIPNPPMADLGTPTNGSPRSPSPLLLTRSGDVIPLPQRALDVELSDRSHTPSPTRHHSKLRPSRLLHHVTFGTGPAPSTGGDSFTSSEASVQASQPALSSAGPQGPRHTTLPPQRASSVPLRTSSSGVLPASIVARRMSSSGDLTYEEIRDMPARQYRARALAQMSESTSFNYRAEADIAVVIRDEEAPPVSAAATSSYQPPAVPDAAPQGPAGQHAGAGPGTGAAAAAQTAAVKPPWQQHLELVWSKLSRVGALFSSALDIAEAPLIILRKGTIPLLDPESYSRPWFLAALACAPLAMLVYLGSGDSLEAMLIALGVGCAASAGAALATRGNDRPPLWSLGLPFPVGAAVVAALGFVVAAMWIDTIASELVGMLDLFGVLSGVDHAILGLTVLAWGNSMGDLSTNLAMAKKGLANMAMTACYAGPVFNMLVALSLGFLRLLGDTHQSSVHVFLSKPVVTGIVFVVFGCAAVLAVGIANGQRLPREFGYVMLGVYALYLVVNISLYAFR